MQIFSAVSGSIKGLIICLFAIPYHILIGLCLYFYVKKKNLNEHSALYYIFLYGGRFRIGISLVLSALTIELFMI
jgi:hypothetical protein